MIRSYGREKEWCATHSPSQTVYTDSHLSDLWMPTLHPLVTAPTAPFAPWRPALLFSHILHCAWNTGAPGPLVILTLSIYNPCIPGMWTATRIIKRNSIGLGGWMLLFDTSKLLFLDLLKLTLQNLATCKGHWSDILANHHSYWSHSHCSNVINNNEKVQIGPSDGHEWE